MGSSDEPLPGALPVFVVTRVIFIAAFGGQ